MLRNTNVIKWAVYGVAFFLLSILQSDPFLFPRFQGMAPLLLVPAVVITAMMEGETAGAAYGVWAGLLWDAQEGRLFGYHALMLLLFGVFVGLLVKYLFRNTLFIAFCFTAFLSAFLELLTWFFFFYLYGDTDLLFAFTGVILPTCLYTLVLVLPLYALARRLSRRLSPEE